MHGPLNEIGLIEVLQLLERGRRSGILRVVGPDASVPRTLRLRDGLVVAVEPDAADQAVARTLVRRQLLPPGEDDPRLLDPAEREAARRHLARRALGTVLHWNRGRFDFNEGPVVAGPLAWSADALVMALVEDESRRVELGEALDGWHAVPEFVAAEALAGGPRVMLEPIDWRILDAVDGQRDVAAVAALLDEPLEEVGERVRSLLAATILQLRPASTAPPSVTHRDAVEAERHDGALSAMRARTRRTPEDPEAWRHLGLAEVGAGHFARAIEAWSAWQRAAPECADEAAALILAARTMMEALRESHD
jgi:hypothetical protein